MGPGRVWVAAVVRAPGGSAHSRSPKAIPMTESFLGAASGAPLSMRATAAVTSAVVRAARHIIIDLERGRRIDAAGLRQAMEAAFGASDASGAWNWKTAYGACEAATVLFLRRYGTAMRTKAASPAAMLPMLTRITNLLPTHTRRSEESQSLQQFSTPVGLAFVASVATATTADDVVLEPSAGTGLLSNTSSTSPNSFASVALMNLSRSIARSISLRTAGRATHSSSCIWMSESSNPWI